MAQNRQWSVDEGLGEILEMMMAAKLDEAVERMRDQVKERVIDDRTLAVLRAFGWVTMRDTRVRTIEPRRRTAKPREIDPPDPALMSGG